MEIYIISCTADPNIRAVYYARDGQPTGAPIMFLRDKGMEEAANELVRRANRIDLDDLPIA